jgi:hypothetical protein
MPAAVRTPRPGGVQTPAAEVPSCDTWRLVGGGSPAAGACASRGGERRRASGLTGAAGRRKTAWPARPKPTSVLRRCAREPKGRGGAGALAMQWAPKAVGRRERS